MDKLLERTDKRIKSSLVISAFIISVGSLAYNVSRDLVVSIISAVIVIIVFVVWDLYEKVETLEKNIERDHPVKEFPFKAIFF
ncbi:MAG: hypothetical protein U9O53_01990 [archaeon]|nr:hypothetical protein [archaeon]